MLQPMTPSMPTLAQLTTDRIIPNGEANESTPKNQRAPVAKTEKKLSDGPKIDPKTGGHLPASYVLPSGSIRTDR